MDPGAEGHWAHPGPAEASLWVGQYHEFSRQRGQMVLRQDLKSKSQQAGASLPRAYGTWLASMPLSKPAPFVIQLDPGGSVTCTIRRPCPHD